MQSLKKHNINATFGVCKEENTEQAIEFLKNKIKK
jgi:hypothetical protein